MFGGFGGSFGGSGVKKYANVSDLPFSGVRDGTLAHVEQNLQGESALYLRTSGGWYKVATINLAPSILVGPDEAYTLPNDGSALVIELSAEDPEGLPIEWAFSASTDLNGIASVDGAGQIFVVSADPAAVAAGENIAFGLTFTVTDGVSVAGATSSFTLAFSIGPANPGSMTIDAEFDSQTELGVTFDMLVAGEPGIVFGVVTSNATTGGVYALDVSDPQSITLLSYYKPPGLQYEASALRATGVYARGNLAVNPSSTLVAGVVVDVSNPLAMSQKITLLSTSAVLGFSGDLLVRCANPGGLQTVSLTGTNGTVVSSLVPYGFASDQRGICVYPPNYDGSVFAWYNQDSTGGRRVLLAEVSESGILSLVSSALPLESALSAPENYGFFDGQFLLYSVRSAGQPIRVFDVSDPTTPVQLSSIPELTDGLTPSGGTSAPQYTKAQILDGYVYASHTLQAEQLRVFDFRDPTSPVNLGVVPAVTLAGDFSSRGPNLAFSGGRLFALSGSSNTLRVLK